MSAIEKVLEFADDVLSLVENEGGELEGGVDTIALAKAELAQLRAELEASQKAVNELRYVLRKAYLDIHNTDALLWTWLTAHPEGKKE